MLFSALGQVALGEVPTEAVALSLTADAAALSWNGQAAGLTIARSVAAEMGAIAWGGQAAGLFATHLPLSAGAAAMAWGGQAAMPLAGFRIAASVAPYSGSGSLYGLFAPVGALALGDAETAVEAATTFAWQAYDVGEIHTHILLADAGAVVWTGTAIDLRRTARVLRLRPGGANRMGMAAASTPRMAARAGGGTRMRINGGREC